MSTDRVFKQFESCFTVLKQDMGEMLKERKHDVINLGQVEVAGDMSERIEASSILNMVVGVVDENDRRKREESGRNLDLEQELEAKDKTIQSLEEQVVKLTIKGKELEDKCKDLSDERELRLKLTKELEDKCKDLSKEQELRLKQAEIVVQLQTELSREKKLKLAVEEALVRRDGELENKQVELDKYQEELDSEKTRRGKLEQTCAEQRTQLQAFVLKQNKEKLTPEQQQELQGRLVSACQLGDVTAVKPIVDLGADVNARGAGDWTPLHHAARCGHVAVVQALLRQGASPHVMTTTEGHTPLYVAAYHGHVGVAKALLSAGADVAAANVNGVCPLKVAAEGGHTEVCRSLLQSGARVDQRCAHNNTPLTAAAQNGHLSTVHLLVQFHADVTATDDDGDDALACAVIGGNKDVIKYLSKLSANK